jgi:hypothetical protein
VTKEPALPCLRDQTRGEVTVLVATGAEQMDPPGLLPRRDSGDPQLLVIMSC